MAGVIIIPAPIGQLGNRLVHFAHVWAFAMQRGLTLLHTAFYPYADSFIGTRESLFCVFDPRGEFYKSTEAKKICELFLLFLDQGASGITHIDCKAIRKKIERISFEELDTLVSDEMRELVFTFGFVLRSWIEAKSFPGLNAEYLAIGDDQVELDTFPALDRAIKDSTKSMVLIDGWGVRCGSALEAYRAEILKLFSPIPELQAQTEELVKCAHRLLPNSSGKLIGLHVRRGDYAKWQGGRYFYSWERYVEFAHEILSNVGSAGAALLICANEKPPNNCFAGMPCIVSAEHPIVDMYALSRCEMIFGPPSTFSGWASFISGAPFTPMR